MLTPIVDIANESLVVIGVLFTSAWVVARTSAWVARHLLRWHDRQAEASANAAERIASIKRRETLVIVIRTAIGYAAFGTAAVLAVAEVAGGFDRLATIAGASFLLVTLGFALQRVLVDLVAGLMMFVEGWYSVGDTIVAFAGTEVQGVVEDVSLRRTRLRALSGEVIQLHNAQISSVRVLPGGVKELSIELFVSKREAAERLVRDLVRLLPDGPTTFIERPWIENVDELSHALTRITMRTTVAPGREWLAEGFFADLLREKAPEGLIVHGPVALAIDERATRSFACARAATRWSTRRSAANRQSPSLAR